MLIRRRMVLMQIILMSFGLVRLDPVNLLYGRISNLSQAVQFLNDYDIEARRMCHLINLSIFNYENNLTDDKARLEMEEIMTRAYTFRKEFSEKANTFAWQRFKTNDSNNTVYEIFRRITCRGRSVLSDEKRTELEKLIANNTAKFGMAKVCCYKRTCKECTMSIEPGLTKLLASSYDYKELLHAWVEWRNAAGGCSSRAPYQRYVSLLNEAAISNGFQNAADERSPDFDLEKLWSEIKPLYLQLHAFVRRKLIEKYPGKIRPDGPIPAHLLGNMWAQSWDRIFSIVEPFPGKHSFNFTPTMRQENMTILEMFGIAEEFFTSLGLKKMTPAFWKSSVFEKPTDREIVCHASSFDMCDGKDYRVKMCTNLQMHDLLVIHHEMGHIEYFQEYAHLPQVFQDGASAGFHEAVGDAIALSVAAPGHFAKLGFEEDNLQDEEKEINFLISQALIKVAMFPFIYIVESWRWGLYNGSIKPHRMNNEWWNLRLHQQGLCPPVKRTEEDFDPIVKFHIASGTDYIRYFSGLLIQFQLHKALCDASGYKGFLHRCDIYRNTNAGNLLKKVLSKGSSLPSSEIIKIMTEGEEDSIGTSAILLYFQPLIQWLKRQNSNETIGWISNDSTICPNVELKFQSDAMHGAVPSLFFLSLICYVILFPIE